jgi:S-adenosylmethionine decarboxylase
MTAGTEWLIEAAGCNADALRDVDLLRGLFQQVIADLGLRVVGDPMWQRFPSPGGITGLVLLSESHLACHTYPEFRLITINLYCCRERPEWPWEKSLRALLGASEVRVRAIERALPIEESTPADYESMAVAS